MNNLLEVKREQLIERLGHIASLDYVPKQDENVLTAYLWGFAPVKFVTEKNISQEDFDRMCR